MTKKINKEEINRIFKECTQDKKGAVIIANDIYHYVLHPFFLYCKYNVDSKYKDVFRPYYVDLMFEKGVEFEDEIIEEIMPEAEEIILPRTKEGFHKVLELMSEGADNISQAPLYYLCEGMMGVADLLTKRKGKSIFGNYYYEVTEIKSGNQVKNEFNLQAFFYNYILGRIQGFTPENVIITTMDDETKIKYDEQELSISILDAKKIISGEIVPEAVYNSIKYEWKTYCNQQAIINRDISILKKLGPNRRENFILCGYNSIEKIAKAEPNDLLHIDGIGKKLARTINASAKAIHNKEVILLNEPPLLPTSEIEIFLDFEGSQDQTGIIFTYLSGIIIRANNKSKYISFVCRRKDTKSILKTFLEFVNFVKKLKKQYTIYHWGNYEARIIETMGANCGLKETTIDKVFLSKMIDVHNIFDTCFALPTYSTSLKEIANFYGFHWRNRGEELGGTGSMALYSKFFEQPKKNAKLLDKIIKYNEDDCNALLVLKDLYANNKICKQQQTISYINWTHTKNTKSEVNQESERIIKTHNDPEWIQKEREKFKKMWDK